MGRERDGDGVKMRQVYCHGDSPSRMQMGNPLMSTC